MKEPNGLEFDPINTFMGTTKKPFAVTTEDQMDHLVGLWDSGELKHSGKNPELIKKVLGLNFNKEKPPYPYSGLNIRKWAQEGHVLVVKTPQFFVETNHIPTPSSLLITHGTAPHLVFCLKPAVGALRQLANAQDVTMYQDIHADGLTYLFRMNDGKAPQPY